MAEPEAASPEPSRLVRALDRPWPWLALALLAFGPFLNFEIGQGNVASDLAAIESLVSRGNFFIDGSPFFDTIDKFRDARGRHFSQKSPIFHLAAAPVALACRAAGRGLEGDPRFALGALTIFFSVLPAGALGWLVWRNPWGAACSTRLRAGLAFGTTFASPLTAFAVTFNHYVPAAACLMAAVNALARAPESCERGGMPNEGGPNAGDAPEVRRPRLSSAHLAAGFWIGASLACDVAPAFLFGAGIAAFLVARGALRALGSLALGAAPALLLYAALDLVILGSPLPPNLHEESMLYYEGSYWTELRERAEAGRPGYYQASYPRRLLHATFGHKGVYWMAPALLLATGGAVVAAWRRRPGSLEPLALALLLPAAIATTMRWAFDLSGGAYGIRHVYATLPPLLAALAHPAMPRPRSEAGRWPARGVLVACFLWSGLVAWIGVRSPWSHNTLSAIPPLENLARFALAHPDRAPTRWIERLIEATSVTRANGWLDLGLERMTARDLPGAERALRRSAAEDPAEPLPLYHLGIALDMQGRPGEAIAVYERLLAMEPGNAGAWNNLGIFSVRAGDLERARTAWTRALEQAGPSGSATAEWGLLALEGMAGRAHDATPRLRDALRRHPGDPRLESLARDWGVSR